jgi:putative transposase
MGLAAIYQRPKTTVRHPQHRVFPYLLRNMAIDKPDQVWCADITCIPMRHGFLYLVAIMDRHSRRVRPMGLQWRPSNTMEADFCIEALEEALSRFGRPGIFNTDQGSQFTSPRFTQVLLDAGVRISMDGRGRWMDNVFIERLWRSLKYECVYLNAFETGSETRVGIGRWTTYYNHASEHPSGYEIEVKRFCCAGGDPAGYFGFCRARAAMDLAASVPRAVRAKTHGPSGRGWMASISPASAASLSVLVETLRSLAASVRLSQGSTPSAADLNTGIR